MRVIISFNDGHPWIDVTLVGVLENIPAEKAQKRVLNNCNTIWEIVNHLIQHDAYHLGQIVLLAKQP